MADPTFMDMLNQGLGNVTGTPLGQLGINMLANSGYDPNGAGMGQRLGRAFGGMVDMQQQQAQTQAQVQLRQIQQMQAMQEWQKIQRENDQVKQQQQYLKEHPEALSQFPTAQAAAQAGVPITGLAPLIKADQAGLPSKPYQYMQNNPDNTQTQMVWDMNTKSYVPGATTLPVAQQQVNATVQNNTATQGARSQELEIKRQQAETARLQQEAAQQRADAMTATSLRESQNMLRTQNIAKATLENGYNGARSQLDKQIETVDAILNDKGMGRTFGWTGTAPTAPGSDAARVESQLAKLRAGAGLTGLQQLAQQGIRLTPVSDNDMRVASESTMSLSNRMSEADARAALTNYRKQLMASRDEAGRNYDNLAKYYEPVQTQQPQAQQPAQGGAPYPVRTGTLPDGRKVIQYSDGSIR